MNVHLIHSSKVKVIKTEEIKVFLLYLLDDGEGSGSVPLTNGSGRPKNLRILRIRIQNTG
jgi:hypothetical protein